MVRTGGSASRTIGDRSATDPGGGGEGGEGGEGGGVREDASRLGRGRWGMSSDLTGLQMNFSAIGGPLHNGLQTA